MQQWCNWLHERKKKDEAKRREEDHQKKWSNDFQCWRRTRFLAQDRASRVGLQVLEDGGRIC